jgi:tRNA (guanine37-N1)-methyltransferase
VPHFPTSTGSPAWRARVVTLHPELFPGPLAASICGGALQVGVWSLETLDLRTFGLGRHRTVDDHPAGGGAGMVLRCDVVAAAIDAARADGLGLPAVYASPRGEPLTQREVSLGDYVLSGGELAAMVMIDACVRLLPGVLGSAASLAEESFADGLLEYPQYTRPREWEGRGIPEVLMSGDHKRIAGWRRAEAERLTRERRPDLWSRRKPS